MGQSKNLTSHFQAGGHKLPERLAELVTSQSGNSGLETMIFNSVTYLLF